MTAAEAADLRTRFAHELFLTNRLDEALAEAEAAVAEWEQLGEPVGLGRALSALSNARYWGLHPGVVEAAERSIAVLEGAGPSAALALGYTNLAFVLVMRSRFPEAIAAATEGAELAELVARPDIRANALAQEGTARMLLGEASGEALLFESLELAGSLGDHRQAVMACIGLVSGSFRLGRLADAERYMEIGIAHAEEHGIVVGSRTLRMMEYGLELARGRWLVAERGLRALVTDPRATGWGETVALALLARLLARRGDPEAWGLLERAWDLATRSGEIQRTGAVAVATL